MDCKYAGLVTRQKVIDEIADDRVRFIAELCHNPADERAAARVPLQIDRAMRGVTMDFGPTVRPTRPLMFSGNQIKPPELRIRHDFFPQRSSAGRDDLDHRLHPLGSTGNHLFCNVCFEQTR